MRIIVSIAIACLYLVLHGVSAQAFDYKKVDAFPALRDFATVSDFEKFYGEYTQTCLDNSYGGTRGIPCFIGSELWDRELNDYYHALYNTLDKQGQEALKQSQRAWLKERDLSIDFNTLLLNQKYSTRSGTMFLLMRAGDAEELTQDIVKQRALQLKKWLEFCSND